MTNTARNFSLQLGSLIALYVSLSAILAVLFGVINLAFPDAAEGYWAYNSAQSGIRFGIAAVIVFFPAYLILTRISNKIRREESGSYTTVTKWLVYLSLIVGGGILLGDLVAVIMTYLNGEITERFILKALALFVVISAAFKYYLRDVVGYWDTHEKQSIMFGGVSVVLVIAVLVLGFYHADTPSTVREMRIDTEQVNDLEQISWRVEEYYSVNKMLPETLSDVYGTLSVPEAVEDRPAYQYRVPNETTFELCATFAHESRENRASYAPIEKIPQSWDHGEGETCFTRVVE
ncbi:hypothetical protein KTR10_02665 [Candidatus Kaiserbacteria bacterium]|nr:hypothetical protein [Candidatus Kaiserbacteria bacterium]